MLHRTIILTAAAILCLALPARGQLIAAEPPAARYAPNAVYVELLGNGLLYSINYEHKVSDLLAARLGFMYMAATGTARINGQKSRGEVALAVVPAMLNFLVGSGSHRLELGAGILLGAASAEAENFEFSGFGFGGVTTTFGYRFQPVGGGFILRIGLTPYYSGGPELSGGVSIGFGF